MPFKGNKEFMKGALAKLVKENKEEELNSADDEKGAGRGEARSVAEVGKYSETLHTNVQRFTQSKSWWAEVETVLNNSVGKERREGGGRKKI